MSVDTFTLELINSYTNKVYNEEFETSLLKTLFRDKKYDLILVCLEKGFILTQKIWNKIVESGDLKLYQFLFSHRWPRTREILVEAIKSGKLETVKWFVKDYYGYKMSRKEYYRYLYLSTEMGHLSILEWMVTLTKDLPAITQKELVFTSIKKGRLSILKWFRDHNIVSNDPYMEYYFSEKHPKIRQWLVDNGCPKFDIENKYTGEDIDFI